MGIRLGVFDQHKPVPLKSMNLDVGVPLSETGPQIAVVTPSFNQAEFVAQTVESVLSQSENPLEYVVQDGGSTDNTANVLQKYAGQLRFFSEKDEGQADAINKGFSKTTAPIMGWLNSDDLLLPGALQRVAATFAANPEADVLYGNRLLIDEQNNVIGEWVLPYHDEIVMRHINYIPQETLFWRRRAWERAGGTIDVNFDFALDWEFILRLCETGSRFIHVPEFLGAFRCHEMQKTATNFQTRGRQEIANLRRIYRAGGSLENGIAHARFLAAHRLAHSKACKPVFTSLDR